MKEKIKKIIESVNDFYEQEDKLAEQNSAYSLLVSLPRLFWAVFCGLGVTFILMGALATFIGCIWYYVS